MPNEGKKVSENYLDELQRQVFTDKFRTEWMTLKGVTLSGNYAKYEDIIEDFNVRDDDVWICTLPKSGTTWTQEMIWCLRNNLDFEGSKIDLWDRVPFLEFAGLVDFEAFRRHAPDLIIKRSRFDSIKFTEELPSPRVIKTHLPFHLLPRDLREGKTRAKIVHVSRNPKDTCVSYYHHCVIREGFHGTFEQFCELFLGGKVGFLPYWDHLYGYLSQQKNEKINILSLKYEDMKANLENIINQVSDFLEKPRLLPEDMKKLLNHLSFGEMSASGSYMDVALRQQISDEAGDKNSGFFRSGETNQWKGAMTPELIKKFDEWISNNSRDGIYSEIDKQS